MADKKQNNQLAIIKKGVVDVVSNKIREFQSNKELNLPANYSPENAMKSAFLLLQRTVTKDKQPVLTHCEQNSIANALLDMVVQGLNPAKQQCYFIPYGKQLTCQRSVFGTMAVAKSLCNAKDIYAQVVWQGDEFEYDISRGNKAITKHKQKIENVGKKPLAAYCVIVFDDREYTDIMTIDQIKQAWTKSKMNPNADSSVHKQFEEEMIRKTVINRTCKRYINSSSDSGLLVDRFHRAEEIRTEAEFEAEVEENANGDIIDIEPDPEPETTVNPNELTEEEKQAIIEQEITESKGPGF